MDQIDDAPVRYTQRDQDSDQADLAEVSIEKLREAVLASATEARRAFFMFGAFSLYLIITVGTTTHEQLLRGSTFELPILNVSIPLIGFYIVVPVLFFLAHLNLLGELNALAENAERLKRKIKDQQHNGYIPFPFGISRVFIQPPEARAPRKFIVFFVIMSAIVLPPFVLLAVQVRLLPYHSEGITWLHRALVAADILALWLLWPRVEKVLRRGWRFSHPLTWLRSVWRYRTIPIVATITMIAISCLVVTIPEEWIERQAVAASQRMTVIKPSFAADIEVDPSLEGQCNLAPWNALSSIRVNVKDRSYDSKPQTGRAVLCLTFLLFEGPGSIVALRRNLIVTNKDLVAIRPMPELVRDKRGEALKAIWEDVGKGLDLRGRDLRFADLAYSDLRRADFRGADLSGARLTNARLNYAQFGDIPITDLGPCTSGLENVSSGTCSTSLRNANFQGANLSFASFFKADLDGVNFYWAKLHDSDLGHVNLTTIAWFRAVIDQETKKQIPSGYHCYLERLGVKYDRLESVCGCSLPPPIPSNGTAVCPSASMVRTPPG